jgi:hypothetical protein
MVSMVFLVICIARPPEDRLTRRYTTNMPLVRRQ